VLGAAQFETIHAAWRIRGALVLACPGLVLPPLEVRAERVGLPLEVTAESGPWRRIRDPDGAQTWMHAQNLDTRRTAYLEHAATLRQIGHDDARAVAYLAPGVVGALTGCQGEWRRIAVGGRVGWVKSRDLWGADACNGL